ncbi:hypothetical protein ACVGWN_00035, partial [Enterobacter hormaechei]
SSFCSLGPARGGCPAHKTTTHPLTAPWLQNKHNKKKHAKHQFSRFWLTATVGYYCNNTPEKQPVKYKKNNLPTNHHNFLSRCSALK